MTNTEPTPPPPTHTDGPAAPPIGAYMPPSKRNWSLSDQGFLHDEWREDRGE